MQTMVMSGSAGKWFIAALGVLFFILGAELNAPAQGAGPCAEDVAKFCKDVKPGEGNIATCLKEHAAELSPGCKEGLQATKQKVQEFSDVCGSDLKKFCKDVKPGGGRMLKCLKGHEQELTPDCKAKMSSAK